MPRLSAYCKCGAAMFGTANGPGAALIARLFWEHHIGEGHGPATQMQAAMARAKDEAQTNRQLAREARGQESE